MYKVVITVFIMALIAGYYSLNLEVEVPNQVKRPMVTKSKKYHRQPELKSFTNGIPSQERLEKNVQAIVGYKGKLDHNTKTNHVHNLSRVNLNEDDFQALFTFLRQRPINSGPQLELHSVKNELLIFLINDGRHRESTGQIIAEIISNPDQHPVMQEYTLQYITDYFQRHKNNFTNNHNQLLTQLENLVWDSLSSRTGPIAGTALIKLHELSFDFDINKERLDNHIIEMAKDLSVSESSRMAAFNMISERNMLDALESVKSTIFDENEPTMIRLVAIGTAFRLNPEKDFYDNIEKAFLEKENADKRLINAVKLNLKNKLKRL